MKRPAPLRLTTTIETPQEHLDLATVVKASQAVSGEIVLEKLIETPQIFKALGGLLQFGIEAADAEPASIGF